MPRWIGLLGSWAMLVLSLGLASFAVAGQVINHRDMKRLGRVEVIDRLIAERAGNKAAELRTAAEAREKKVSELQSRLATVTQRTEDVPATGQTIVISTAENKLYVRRGGQTIFEAVCSTGKGTTLVVDGRTRVFDTPTGKFHIKSREENPVWVPPDWHYVEQARKSGMRVVRLGYNGSIDKNTGYPARGEEGVWSWFGDGGPKLRVKGKTVIVDYGDYEQELPPGQMIVAGDAVVIPPVGTPQRRFEKVLGRFRLNLGDGYAIHGTQETGKLGQAVSHGCVRLGDEDIEKLYAMSKVGDEVIIY